MVRFSNARIAEAVQPFWAALQAGEFIADAAVQAGTYRKQGTRWVAACGGVRPRRGRDLKGRCLSFAEREEIALARARRDDPRGRPAPGAGAVDDPAGTEAQRRLLGRLPRDGRACVGLSACESPPSRPSRPPTRGCANSCRTTDAASRPSRSRGGCAQPPGEDEPADPPRHALALLRRPHDVTSKHQHRNAEAPRVSPSQERSKTASPLRSPCRSPPATTCRAVRRWRIPMNAQTARASSGRL